ncbi:MAG: sigma-70 family RNA polymerase sigma factor, partial [Myxococcales bacterium]|nr:sigma-70 family RNA polymerase sigma factor [Myxococcales bacterium]
MPDERAGEGSAQPAESEGAARRRLPPTDDDAFAREYRALVMSIATKVHEQVRFAGDREELEALGFKGLVEARSRFDPTRGVQFNTFAYYRIRGAIMDGVRSMSALPPSVYHRIRLAEAQDRVGEQVVEARASRQAASPYGRVVGGDALRALEAGLGRLATAFVVGAATATGPEDGPDERLIAAEQAKRVRALVTTLPERERVVLEGHYFEGRRLEDIGAELGISKSWASRLHSRALDRLRVELTRDERGPRRSSGAGGPFRAGRARACIGGELVLFKKGLAHEEPSKFRLGYQWEF